MINKNIQVYRLNKLIEDVEEKSQDEKDGKLQDAHEFLTKQANAGGADGKNYLKQNIINILDSQYSDIITMKTIDEIIGQYHINYYFNLLGDDKKNEFYNDFEVFRIDENSDFQTKLEKLGQIIYQELYGYGVIDELIYRSDLFNEVSCNGHEEIYVTMKGHKFRINNLSFRREEDLLKTMDKMTSNDAKNDLTPTTPFSYSQTAENNRVTAIVKNLGDKPYLFHRNFSAQFYSDEQLIKWGTVNHKIIEFNKQIMKGRPNISVVGTQGVGKTTSILNLVKNIPDSTWIGILETSRELNIPKVFPSKNVVSLVYDLNDNEFKYLGVEEVFGILLRTSRDIIIIGETRYPKEAVVSIDCMSRGTRGSIESFHTSSPESYIYDKRNLLLRSGYYPNDKIATLDVANSTDLIYHYKFDPDTKRRYLDQICEVIADQKNFKFELNTIVKYNREKGDWDFINTISDYLKEQFKEIGQMTTSEVMKIDDFFNVG